MKNFFVFLMLLLASLDLRGAPGVPGSTLPDLTVVTGDDAFFVVDDLAGTPVTKKVTAARVKAFVDLNIPLNISGTSIDLAQTNRFFSKNLTANTTFTFDNVAEGRVWTAILTNGASWTVTWPTVTWPGGPGAPVMDTGVGVVNIFSFIRSGGKTFGSVAQGEISLSAVLATQITDETGTGPLVFGIGPVLSSPVISLFTDALHDHQNANGGGLLSVLALESGIFQQMALTLTTTNCLFDQTGGTVTNSYYLTATGNVYFTQPTNLISGKDFTIFVRQDATGARTIGFDTNHWISANLGGVFYPALTNASSVEIISGRVDPSGTNVYFVQSLFPR